MKKRSGITKLILLSAGAWLCMGLSHPSASASDSDMDGTMLMFVGEELEVVTVASRIPESPSNAPAVVRVVDHGEIRKKGYHTLAELLSSEPGFYIADQGLESVPYLRGISNGILVLYDGVPIPTGGGTRSYFPLDDQLSLNSVKRVEIIRGPGSVLWGADAFAGIVNIVPFSGKDSEANQVKLYTATDTPFKGFASVGYQGEKWDTYLSVYGARKDPDSYLSRDVLNPQIQNLGGADGGEVGDSEYYEVTANFNFKDCFSISGRFSDFSRTYTQNTFPDSELVAWASENKAPVNHVKMNYAKVSGSSHWNVTAYYQDVTLEQEDAGASARESAGIFYGELLWDRRLFKKGLMTAGLSYREDHVHDALVDGGFVPGLLVAEYPYFQQRVNFFEKDFKKSLTSLFTQYRHPFSWGELWAGFRLDDNSIYEDDAVSYNLGLNVPVTTAWRFKAVFGTGYRTPYAQQLTGDKRLTRDEIATVNLQLEWDGGRDNRFSVTAYHSSLSDNVQPDPSAGVSEPSDQEFSGVELYFSKYFSNGFNWSLSMSKLFSSGDTYNLSAYRSTTIGAPGTPPVDIYDEWEEQYDPGPDFVLSSSLVWQLNENVEISLSAYWSSPIPYSYNQDTITGEYDNPLLLNGKVRLMKLIENLEIEVGCKNIFDDQFDYPGFYGPVEGDPLNLYTSLIYHF